MKGNSQVFSLPSQSFVLAPAQGPTFWILGLPGQAKATAEQTGGAFSLVEVACPPNYASPLHIHYLEDEAVYVLEGRLTFFSGDRPVPAVAGSYIFQPRGVAHGFRVHGDTPTRLLCLTLPASANQGPPPGHARRDQLGPEGLDLELLADLVARHKIDILGPLPNPAAA